LTHVLLRGTEGGGIGFPSGHAAVAAALATAAAPYLPSRLARAGWIVVAAVAVARLNAGSTSPAGQRSAGASARWSTCCSARPAARQTPHRSVPR
jgi:hypothetical protein